jgi:hypothetical protein
MKFNKWTLGLAAVGVVSLASAARADEKMSSLQTALSDTTISGYVSASANWAITPGGGAYESSPAQYIPFQGVTKQDGFNLDVVKLSIAKPEDESPWASGYQIDLMFGPDAVNYNTSVNAKGYYTSYYGNEYGTYPDFAIKQAYVSLRTPVGNGIDWKIGVWDTVIGYEVTDAGSNPNYTRSIGYWLEPTEHTGVLASYKVNDQLSFSAGIANSLSAGINNRNTSSGFADNAGSFSKKTVMASATWTAPSTWGWAAGSSLYSGFVYGFNGGHYSYANGNQFNGYVGATINTPLKQLTTGFALDYVHNLGGGWAAGDEDLWSDVIDLGLYATWKQTDKLSFNARGEYWYGSDYYDIGSNKRTYDNQGMELTATVEYDLWANVTSRLELRYDHLLGDHGYPGISTDSYYYDDYTVNDSELRTSLGLYANIIYKF